MDNESNRLDYEPFDIVTAISNIKKDYNLAEVVDEEKAPLSCLISKLKSVKSVLYRLKIIFYYLYKIIPTYYIWEYSRKRNTKIFSDNTSN